MIEISTYVSALEEEHVASEDLGEWVPVERSLGPVLGDPVAVHVPISQLLLKLGVCSSNAELRFKSFNICHRLHVPINVDLEVRCQELHFSEDTGEVSHLCGNAFFEFSKIFKELNEVILISIEKTIGRLALGSPERSQLVHVLEICQPLEWVVVDSSWQS